MHVIDTSCGVIYVFQLIFEPDFEERNWQNEIKFVKNSNHFPFSSW